MAGMAALSFEGLHIKELTVSSELASGRACRFVSTFLRTGCQTNYGITF